MTTGHPLADDASKAREVHRHHQGRGLVDRHLALLRPVIITLAIISAAFGNLGPRLDPYFYTLEVV